MKQDAIVFDAAAAERMLSELAKSYTEGQIEIVGFPAARGAPVAARHFPVGAVDAMVAYAARLNARPGINAYVGPARREGAPEHARATDAHVVGTRWIWFDFDDPGVAERASGWFAANGSQPNLLVTTGTVPHLRQQAFLRLSEEIEPARAATIMRDLQRLLGSDPSVKNPSRVMRLAGSIAWSKPGKPGRVDEPVTLLARADPIGIEPGFLERLGSKQTKSVHAPYEGAHRPFRLDECRMTERAGPAEVREILEHIHPDAGGYEQWCTVLMGLHDHFDGGEDGLRLAEEWSARGPLFRPGETSEKWRSFSSGAGVTFATVCALARQNGAELSAIARRHRRQPSGGAAPDSSEAASDISPIAARARAEALPDHSEEALALRFADRHASGLRFVAPWGRWLGWRQTHWESDSTLGAMDLARAICRQTAAACDNPTRAAAVASAKTVAAVERLAKADRRLVASTEQWDADPWLLNTPAGVVDLRSGRLREHRPEDYQTRLTATAPAGECPTWRRFLAEVTGGDSELQFFLQRLAGYALTGSTQEHSLAFLHGSGANGKSVFTGTLAGLLGSYHKTAPIETFTASGSDRHPTEVAMLRGARLVTAVETEEGRRWAESRIKALTGGDRIAARFMRQDFFEFTPQFKLLIAGNHKPGLRSVDEAIRRRFHLVPFTVTIPPERRDPDLGEKLKAEWPGILAWAIEGCLAWQRVGLAPPESVLAATADYLDGQDAIGAWLDECCDIASDGWETRKALYTSWKDWAERTGEFVLPRTRFIDALTARGFAPHRRNTGQGFRGLRLRQPDYSGAHWNH